jgi:hypothetical protein
VPRQAEILRELAKPERRSGAVTDDLLGEILRGLQERLSQRTS